MHATVAAPRITLEDIRAARELLGPRIRRTPVQPLSGPAVEAAFAADTRALMKLELFQHTGSFKARSALLNALLLPEAERARGVCAISAGNHAIAVAFAASTVGTSAKVVMKADSNPFRIEQCRYYGADIELVADVHVGFRRVQEIAEAEGRTFIHPYEGLRVASGTGTLGLEFLEQAPDLEAVIVPVGGGGLCAGVATAVKLALPHCQVFGVEPAGADSMRRSLAAGKPEAIDAVRTIADSLGAPHAAAYSFELCRRALDDLVLVQDDELRRAMGLLFRGVKLAVEPAGAAATAALLGPLRERLGGRRVGVIVCGTNIDAATFARLVTEP
jgi:threonine dehydratase